MQAILNMFLLFLYIYFFFGGGGGLECVGHSFSYVTHFVLLRNVWIRTHRAGVASIADLDYFDGRSGSAILVRQIQQVPTELSPKAAKTKKKLEHYLGR
jgi:hypothetical protein